LKVGGCGERGHGKAAKEAIGFGFGAGSQPGRAHRAPISGGIYS